MDKNLNSVVVIDGGEVKTKEDGVITGLGIVFGSPSEPDQSSLRDFFTADSFIMKKSSFDVPLYHNHGFPIKHQIGEATLTKTAEGWSAEARIDLDDELGKQVYKTVKNTPYGFSTGALSHLVEREAKANNTNFLSMWPVGELSLTPRPAERKAVVQTIKSLENGEIVYEDVKRYPTEEEKADSVIVEFHGMNEGEVWIPNSGMPVPEWMQATENIKAIEVKDDVMGSVSYSITSYNDDGSGMSISSYEWGGEADLIAHLQEILAVAAAAQVADDAVEAFEDSLEPADMTSGKNKNFEARVAEIVKSMMVKSDNTLSELASELQDAKDELAQAELKFSDSEANLAEASKTIARLEILAGAKETIKNVKGK